VKPTRRDLCNSCASKGGEQVGRRSDTGARTRVGVAPEHGSETGEGGTVTARQVPVLAEGESVVETLNVDGFRLATANLRRLPRAWVSAMQARDGGYATLR